MKYTRNKHFQRLSAKKVTLIWTHSKRPKFLKHLKTPFLEYWDIGRLRIIRFLYSD